MVGGGLTMEGIQQNYMVYQFMIDRIWSNRMINIDKWLDGREIEMIFIQGRNLCDISVPDEKWYNNRGMEDYRPHFLCTAIEQNWDHEEWKSFRKFHFKATETEGHRN